MQGMNGSKNQEQILANEPWYHGLLPRDDMKVLLTQNGDFLVRFTDPKPGEPRKFVLSVLLGNGDDNIRHYVFQEKQGKFALEEKWFNSIAELLNYYHRSKEPVSSKSPETVLIRPIGREPWEKMHTDVKLLKVLGEGAFGEVHMGEIKVGNTVRKAAVKLAKLESLTKEQIKEIMHEARLMRRFHHRNVVTFYGVAAGQEPLMVIMELADNGALDSYLKKNAETLTILKRSEMILQAARGLEYLHSLNVIHRDIAARNCLYGNGQVKISDFGLSRDGPSYKMNPHKKIPIRWLAPEVPRTGFYTAKTDVFAYGIMCWEVYHDGQEPYSEMRVADVLPKVQEGYRLPFKTEVPECVALYITNKVCSGEELERTTMTDVVQTLPSLTGVSATVAIRAVFLTLLDLNLVVSASNGSILLKEEDDSYFKPRSAEVGSNVVSHILPHMTQPIGATDKSSDQADNKPMTPSREIAIKKKPAKKTAATKSMQKPYAPEQSGFGNAQQKKVGLVKKKLKSSSNSAELPGRKSFVEKITKKNNKKGVSPSQNSGGPS